ncbi:hypothetical protein AA23498_1008 [Acetobacter nitrogenifigens DSM 23921 = NBRC 105050]|nr:hypothetical protein AA23498_1008 [Acetobacter nitrogenifigens DSM 23921 = NBRC 105050]
MPPQSSSGFVSLNEKRELRWPKKIRKQQHGRIRNIRVGCPYIGILAKIGIANQKNERNPCGGGKKHSQKSTTDNMESRGQAVAGDTDPPYSNHKRKKSIKKRCLRKPCDN